MSSRRFHKFYIEQCIIVTKGTILIMKAEVKEKKKGRVFYLFIMFMLISFLGWCMETVYFLVVWNDLTDRGFLSMPFCTIYGCSILAIYLIIGTPAGGRLKPLFERAKRLPTALKMLAYIGLYCLYFVFAALIPTIAEFVTALFFDKVFGVVLWDYSYHTYDLYGYVCLEMTVLWGVVITAAMSIVWPLLEKLVYLIPQRAAKAAAILSVVLLSADFVFNFSYLCIKGKHLVLY